jgi:hypothetical protein
MRPTDKDSKTITANRLLTMKIRVFNLKMMTTSKNQHHQYLQLEDLTDAHG